jgi:hypothetical protein
VERGVSTGGVDVPTEGAPSSRHVLVLAYPERQDYTLAVARPRQANCDLPATSCRRRVIQLPKGRMAVHASSQSASYHEAYADDDRGYGWVVFAGVLLLILGTLNTIEGIAAIGNANFFVHNTHHVIANLNTWGWIVLCIGVLELCIGVGAFAKNQFSRWTGVLVLSLNAIAQLLMMPAYPFWSLSIFTLDILAIYGLIAYGKRIATD